MSSRHAVRLIAFGLLVGALTVPPQAAAQGAWAIKAPLPETRHLYGVGVVNGLVYAVGGVVGPVSYSTSVIAYDPASDAWSGKAPMLTGRQLHGVGVVNGLIYAVGGQSNATTIASVEAYDPIANAWTARAPMLGPRERMAIAVVDGILYAVGGCTDTNCSNFVSTVEAYDPLTDSWSSRAAMPTARRDLAATAIDGLVYAVGGAFGPGCNLTSVLEAYNPQTDSWTPRAAMPGARNTLASGAVGGILYAIGGSDCDGSLATNQAYDASTDTWSTAASMPTARAALAAGVSGGVLYAVGGAGFSNNEAFTAELTVGIDIKPGSDPNSINLGSAGVVPVAILGSTTFDATQVDPESVTLAGASVRLIGRGSKFACAKEDANGDGFVDLVCHVETAQFMIESGSASAVLTATTFAGQNIRGEDSIHIVP